jgi:hypothetical protein
MSPTLRALCVIGSAITFWLIIRRVKKASVRIDDCIFWIVFSFALLVIAVFPDIPAFLARLFGFMATSNFVFLVVITILLMREFTNTLKISKLNSRLDELIEEQALQAKENEQDER